MVVDIVLLALQELAVHVAEHPVVTAEQVVVQVPPTAQTVLQALAVCVVHSEEEL